MSAGDYYYFDIRARSFVNEALLAMAGVEYTIHRVSFAEWQEMKPQFVFGQLPAWKDAEIGVLAQSDAISRYFARKYGLYGHTLKDSAQIDEVYEEFNDLLNAIIKVVFAGPQFEEKKAAFIANDLPKHISFAEKLLARNGTGWFVGDNVSVADVQAFHVLNNWARPFAPELLSAPVKAFLKKFREVPAIASYLKEKLPALTTPNVPHIPYLNKPEQFAGEFDD
jgi:glutathione S-transferase